MLQRKQIRVDGLKNQAGGNSYRVDTHLLRQNRRDGQRMLHTRIREVLLGVLLISLAGKL